MAGWPGHLRWVLASAGSWFVGGAHALEHGPLPRQASVFLLFCRSPELSLQSVTAREPGSSQRPNAVAEARLLPVERLLALISGLHAGDEGVALVPAVVLVGVVQGHAHTLVLVPLVPDVPPLDGVLNPLLFHAEATRSTPAHFHQHLMSFVLFPEP